MHLLVPFASDLSEACKHVLRDLPLANLGKLLTRLAPAGRDEASEYSLSPPHERALAAARGWQGGDGALPFAAHAASADGLAVEDRALGLMTPAHWQLGRDHVSLLDPAELELASDESQALFDSLRELVTSERFSFDRGEGNRWYLGRDDLDGLPTASLDRVVGRNVDLWLGSANAHATAAQRATSTLLRRLQSEAQLVWHEHPVNEAREERGALAVNSFWLSGCGRLPATPKGDEPTQITTLRKPSLDGDWAAWAEAWTALDSGPLAALAARASAGEPVTLTLCGERTAATFAPEQRSWLGRLRASWRPVEPHDVLSTL